ncbi:unnamed protein product [Symbiodinium sp. CCMP2592]|nr:unnamed protein product [Symbiodinium sp. CCMP2592]
MEQADVPPQEGPEVAHGDVAEDCEVADQGDQQECAVAQGDLAEECEVAQCDQQECAVAQGGMVNERESLPEYVKDMLVRHYTVQRPANPEEIHSQVLLRSASEVEAVFVRPLHLDVPVPDTPLKTPDRRTEDASTTPSTVKVYRNTSSYKAAASPVPFLPDGPMMAMPMEGCGENPPMSEVAASGSNQMVVARQLFPDTAPSHDDPMPPVDTNESETFHDNPYSRECAVVAKRGKEASATGTPLKPELKKAKMVRQEMAQNVWLSVVYPLKDVVPDAMPTDCILDARLSYAIAPPDNMPELSDLWTPEELAEMQNNMPVRKSITVLLSARGFYVNKCYFNGEFEIQAFWTA